MREFKVSITETLTKTVLIDAETVEEAEAKVRDKWSNSEYILDADDIVIVDFRVVVD